VLAYGDRRRILIFPSLFAVKYDIVYSLTLGEDLAGCRNQGKLKHLLKPRKGRKQMEDDAYYIMVAWAVKLSSSIQESSALIPHYISRLKNPSFLFFCPKIYFELPTIL
jgi:hypothetical protein